MQRRRLARPRRARRAERDAHIRNLRFSNEIADGARRRPGKKYALEIGTKTWTISRISTTQERYNSKRKSVNAAAGSQGRAMPSVSSTFETCIFIMNQRTVCGEILTDSRYQKLSTELGAFSEPKK